MQPTPAELQALLDLPAQQAWEWLRDYALRVCKEPLAVAKVREIEARDRQVGHLDTWLASCAWELWSELESCIAPTSQRLQAWWSGRATGKAVLILDGLSLRELPWLLEGATRHGLATSVDATRSELPAETNAFAKALGMGQRSRLQNNALGLDTASVLPGAVTETVDLPFADSLGLVGSQPDWVFWHQWPDVHLHAHEDIGKGLGTFETECAETLLSDEFWAFVKRLAQGRSLVITSDHGYAAPGLFHDAQGSHKEFLKETFKSQRFVKGAGETGAFVPPIAIELNTAHGPHRFCIGRWKWKSGGGYPTVAHGGLSLLEVFVPWVEISSSAAL
jgi:hypothetical protein